MKNEIIKPFMLEKQDELIIPFTINNAESEDGEKTESESGGLEKPDILKVPFSFLTDDVRQMAQNLCLPLQSIYGNATESLFPYIGQALQNFKNEGHEIPCVLPTVCQNFGNGYFNFNVILKKKTIHITDTENGEIGKISYHVNVDVYLKNGQIQNYEAHVESDKIKSHTWLTHATNSLAKLPKEKDERKAFDDMIQRCIESQNVPIELIYPNAGWRNIPDIGWRYVYGEGAIGVKGRNIHTKKCDENFSFATKQISQSEIFREALEIRKICRSYAASTMLLLFTHASTMETFFEEVNFPINFVFGIVGVTNSRKTSLALEITRVFRQSKKQADAEFTATSAGIEKTLSKYKDAPILIDDFRPGETRADQKKLNERLESLVRFYGNRIPKRRMDDYSANTEKFFPIQGLCVLTMEIIAGVQSSLSRMMIVEIDKNEVRNDALSYFQKNPWILSSHIYDFIVWETENQNFIMQTILSQMPCLRMQYKFEFQRFGEMYAVFHIVANFLGYYGKNRGFWNTVESDLFVQECDAITLSLLRNMERKLKKTDKGIIVIQALAEAIENGKFSVTKLNSESCQARSIIYEDNTRIFVQTKVLKKIAEEYCMNYKIETVFISEDEIISALDRLEVLDVYEKNGKRERARKLPIQHGNHLRYLYIIKEKLQNKIDEI